MLINFMPMPADMEEAFLRQVLEYETTEPISLYTAKLENAGLEMPAPNQLNDATLAELKEVIDRLASTGGLAPHKPPFRSRTV